MIKSPRRAACIYDFDLTLTEEYQQMPILRAFARPIEEKHGVQPENYFATLCSGQGIEVGVGAMQQFILDAQNIFFGVSTEVMKNYYARQIQLAAGLPEWFPCINEAAEKAGLTLEHHVVSAGFKPLIEGSIIAPYLASIRSGTFIDNERGIYKIKTIVDPNNKRDEITKICKGTPELEQDFPIKDYHLRYDHVLVFGDGHSDKRMFNFVRERGGIAIGVYEKNNAERRESAKEELNGRVHYLVPRDYSAGTPLEQVVRQSLQMIAKRTCKFDFHDIRKLQLHHYEDSKQIKLAWQHLRRCGDCQERSKETKVI